MKTARLTILSLCLLLLLAAAPARAEDEAAPEPESAPSSEASPSPEPLPSPSPSPSPVVEHRARPPKGHWLFVLAPSYGYAHFEHSPVADSSAPLFSWGLDLDFAYRPLSWLLLGIESGFRYTGHRGSELSALSANVRGTRVALLSPMLGVELGSFRFTLAFQLMGDYVLATPASDLSLRRYAHPSGARLEISRAFFSLGGGKLGLGLRAERVKFSQAYRNGNLESTDPSGIVLSHISLVVPYEF